MPRFVAEPSPKEVMAAGPVSDITCPVLVNLYPKLPADAFKATLGEKPTL
jgi:hypothetical protein